MIAVTQLDDDAAEHVLAAIARDYSDGLEEEVYDMPDLRSALMEYFAVEPTTTATSSGDLARQALLLVTDDPAWSRTVELVSRRPAANFAHRFDVATIALTTAVLFVLRTEIEISRDKSGKWLFKLKSRAVGDLILKNLVQKLISYLPN